MTPGTNLAIKELADIGQLTHVSIFSTGDYFKDGINMLSENNIKKGLHFNLTYGKSANGPHELTDKHGIFKYGFIGILLKSFKPSVRKIIEKELNAQLNILKSKINYISHIDGHRHVHMIPTISNLVKRVSKEFNIKEIRVMNESIVDSLLIGRKFNLDVIGGCVKFFLLNFFCYINSIKSDYHFFSTIYTGQINTNMLFRTMSSNKNYEIMIHPSKPELDSNIEFYDRNEKAYRLSFKRSKELEACLNFQAKK
jgi:chitin disaccharide deacetylase